MIRWFALLTCALLLVVTTEAFSHADGLYSAAYRQRATPRTVEVPYGSMTAHIEVLRRLSATDLRLFSSSNDNEQYWFHGTVPVSSSELVLVLKGQLIAPSGTSVSRASSVVHFRVSRAVAERISTAFAVTRLDRAPLGARLEGRFSLPQRQFAVGDEVRVRLEVHNPANAPATQWQVGGRQRGPRDNRFHLRVWRDGVALAELQGWDFGGPTGFVRIGAGATVEASASIASWADLSAPGRYRVECRYETTLAPDGVDAWAPDQQHRVWDRTFDGVVEFELTASRDQSQRQ